MNGPAPGDALRHLLAGLPERVPVELIDRIWVFPPRQTGGRETGLAVLAVMPEEGHGGNRRVVTLRYEIRGSGAAAATSDLLTEQGTAPAESVQRIIDGVLRRLREDEHEPSMHEIAGDPERWADLLGSLAPAEG